MSVRSAANHSTVSVLARQKFKLARRRLIDRWTIVRGDKVQIMKGTDKGKQGIIKKVLRDHNSIIIDGLKMRTRIISSTQESTGKIIKLPAKIHRSNIAIVDPTTQQPTKIKIGYNEEGHKIRISSSTGNIIPKPDILRIDGKGHRDMNTKTDTITTDVIQRTYDKINDDQRNDIRNTLISIYDHNREKKIDNDASIPLTSKQQSAIEYSRLYPLHPHSKRTPPRLPRLPLFHYQRADRLIGQHQQQIQQERIQGIPTYWGNTIRH